MPVPKHLLLWHSTIFFLTPDLFFHNRSLNCVRKYCPSSLFIAWLPLFLISIASLIPLVSVLFCAFKLRPICWPEAKIYISDVGKEYSCTRNVHSKCTLWFSLMKFYNHVPADPDESIQPVLYQIISKSYQIEDILIPFKLYQSLIWFVDLYQIWYNEI